MDLFPCDDDTPIASLAQVFNVSSDTWLGQANGAKLITLGHSHNHAIVLKQDGSLGGLRRASKALLHASRVGAPATDDSDPEVKKLMEIGTELRLQDAVMKANATLYDSLAVDEPFVAVKIDRVGHERCTKTFDYLRAGKRARERFTFAHRMEGDATGCVRSYITRPDHILLLRPEPFAAWQAGLAVQAAKAGLMFEEYVEAECEVHNQVLRLARAIGARAVPHAFDVESGEAQVTAGAFMIRFIHDASDLMTVRVERGGQLLAQRGGLVSISTYHHAPGGPWFKGYAYNELGCAAYQCWRHAKGAFR